MEQESLFRLLMSRIHLHEEIAKKQGEKMKTTITYGAEVLWVKRIADLANGLWSLECHIEGTDPPESTVILCHPLAYPIRLEFTKETGSDPKREIGFRTDGVDLTQE